MGPESIRIAADGGHVPYMVTGLHCGIKGGKAIYNLTGDLVFTVESKSSWKRIFSNKSDSCSA